MNLAILKDFKDQEWLHLRFRNKEKTFFSRISSPIDNFDQTENQNLVNVIKSRFENIKYKKI